MSSSTKSSYQHNLRAKSPSLEYPSNDQRMVEVRYGESPSSFIKNDGLLEPPTALEHPPLKVSEHTRHEKGQVREEVPSRIREQMSGASSDAPVYRSREDAGIDTERHSGPSSMPQVLEATPCEGKIECGHPPRLSAPSKPSSGRQESAPLARADVTSQADLQTAELSKRYDALSKEYEILRGKLQEQESSLKALKADNVELQQLYEGQSSRLASTRDQLRSCQSQLDNVQRFISTADQHADQEVIQMLQALNEEIYGITMTVADYVTEGHGFSRRTGSGTAYSTKGPIHIGEDLAETIGQTMIRQLATAENEDIALYLQIAFQGFLSHLLYRIVSFWTIDTGLNAFFDETYRRMRRAETQAIFGRWRSLTRTYVSPTPVSNPDIPLEYAITGLIDIVVAAGFSTHHNATSKLSSKYEEKILSIMSHAGRLANMVSGTTSGDFEVFVVQPETAFDGGKMRAVNDDKTVTRRTGVVQTVLCVSRAGLRKHVAEKTMILTKAQVVLKSSLGSL